ncbi:MAG TPA: M1 family aminopeptidase [Thermoanaerobaculia bacterium]|nr:M1 family aminopeptidase [Thermoanaerobaculia bacterium]
MRRAWAVYRLELAHTLTRPLFWFLVLLLALMSWGLSTGSVTISSGDTSVGGTRAWITSEFSFAYVVAILVSLIYSFFVAIGAGMAVVQDDDLRIGEVLHATPLGPGEYVWGKFLALATAFLAALALHLLGAMAFNHLLPNPAAADIRGPFDAVNYLRPAAVFAVPSLLFFAGIAFYLGERTRRPLLVFLFPLAVLLITAFFLWEWAPSWLDPRINRALMLVDPAGFRWLNETWLKVDRGAKFYNTARIGLDPAFLASRAIFLGLGLLGVALAARDLAGRLRGPREAGLRPRAEQEAGASPPPESLAAAAAQPWPAPADRRLAELAMASREPGRLAGCLPVARAETRNLFSSPGIYIFTALILLQTLGNSLLALGAFETELLLTPGLLAMLCTGFLSVLVPLLLMFYVVESVERDRSTGLAAISHAAPTRTVSLLAGKAVANSAVGLLVVAAVFVGCVIALLVQGTVRFEMWPFVLVWGLLLVPTFLVWTAFVAAVQALFGQRYVTYGVGLAVLAFTGYRLFTNRMNWVGNWPLWRALQWSDLGAFEIDRQALWLSRLMALGAAAFFTALAVRVFARREADAVGILHGLRPAVLGRRALRLAPLAFLPLAAGVLLWLAVLQGFQGDAVKKKAKDYWRQNLATWKDAPRPAIAAVDLDVSLEPARRWLHSRGTYRLTNDQDAPLPRFALTGGAHWRKVSWTLDGRPYKPTERTGLYVFTPPRPLPPGGRLAVGFDFEGRLPEGVTKNGGRTEEFILPSGVVLTSFTPSFAPVVGYLEEVGIDKDNRYEPRVYPPDFYEGRTDAAFGSNSPFSTRIRITAPAAYTANSVGVRVAESVAAGRRTVVWRSDQPVRFFNIVAGRWRVRRGEGTAIFYDPRHAYNVAAMSAALDAARRYYSEWFYPYPWRELKLSEFPALAGYAQGFPTNISFSEQIGFLTKSDVKTDAVFLVTAHEAAHQWWGNILTPGKGPGADILSEGAAHFSTMLLFERVKGPAARIEFAKRIEDRYGERRHVDAEHPLTEIDGSRQGDTTVTYDKGGWVFWMMLQRMGRERMLAGIQRFIADWREGPDHATLHDLIAALRPFAPDPAAYDDFVKQWFYSVVVPEYQLADARSRELLGGSAWEVTVRVKNAGTGRMPVEIAATRGERFGKDGKPKGDYRESRATVVLGAGEERKVTLRCAYKPQRVLADPDALVLQLRRKAALARL